MLQNINIKKEIKNKKLTITQYLLYLEKLQIKNKNIDYRIKRI